MDVVKRAAVVASSIVLLASCSGSETGRGSAAARSLIPTWELSTKSDEARKYVEAGEWADESGRPLKAYEQFKRSVAADSAFAYAYLRIAQTALSLDEYRTNLERAVAYSGTANDIELLLIEIERKQFARDQQGALELARQLVEKEPDNPRAWWVLGGIQAFGAGQVEEGRASWRKAMELAPQSGSTHLYYGNAYLTEPRDFAKAEEHIRIGQELWPEEPLSYDYLGDLQRAQGKLDEAARSYSRMIELDPEPADQYSQRGHVYTFFGRYDQARADYDMAIRHSKPNERAVYARFRATVSAFAGDLKASIAELEQVVQAIDGMGLTDPDDQKQATLQQEARFAMHAGEFQVAEDALARRAELRRTTADKVGTPEFRRGAEAGIVLLDGFLALAKGDVRTAERTASEFMRIVEPDRNPTKNRPAHAMLGMAALAQKKYTEALSHFDQSDPDDVYLWHQRALALEGTGRTDEAKELFRRVANYNFNNPGYALVRAEAIAKAR